MTNCNCIITYDIITEAIVAVENSGISEWDWGGVEWDKISRMLSMYIYHNDLVICDETLRTFIRDVLKQNPADYSL